MRNLARKLMVKTLQDTIALPKSKLRAELLKQAEISLAGFEAAAHDESLTTTKKHQAKMFKEEVRLTANAVKSAMKGKR